jgi:hypothetical protein
MGAVQLKDCDAFVGDLILAVDVEVHAWRNEIEENRIKRMGSTWPSKHL